jgi:hypothetical protein
MVLALGRVDLIRWTDLVVIIGIPKDSGLVFGPQNRISWGGIWGTSVEPGPMS